MRSRAVSQVIVAIILIAIALVAASIFAVMVQGMLSAQAKSPKAMVSLAGVDAYAVTSDGVAVTAYVVNTGNEPVTVSSIRVVSPGTIDCSASLSVTVNPGETKPVSVLIPVDYTHCTTVGTVSAGLPVFVLVQYTSDAGSGSVGTATKLQAPS